MGTFQWGSKANESVGAWAAKVDGPTGLAANDAANVLVLAVKILRWPTFFLAWLLLPMIGALALIALLSEGAIATLATVAGVAIGGLWGLFVWRRAQLLNAIDEPVALATEIAIAAEMSGRPVEIAGELTSLGRASGMGLIQKLRSLWSKTDADPVWIRRVSDLERAKYFFPPSIGRTTTLAVLTLWAVPIGAIATFLLFVAAIAR